MVVDLMEFGQCKIKNSHRNALNKWNETTVCAFVGGELDWKIQFSSDRAYVAFELFCRRTNLFSHFSPHTKMAKEFFQTDFLLYALNKLREFSSRDSHCLSPLFYVSTQATFPFVNKKPIIFHSNSAIVAKTLTFRAHRKRAEKTRVDVDAHCTYDCMTFGLFRNFIYSVELISRTSMAICRQATHCVHIIATVQQTTFKKKRTCWCSSSSSICSFWICSPFN